MAAEELNEGELKKHDFAEFVIPSGDYNGLEIKNFRKDLSQIKVAFDQLLAIPDLDPN